MRKKIVVGIAYIILTVLFGVIAVSPISRVSTQPSEEWIKTIGGWDWDVGYCVQQTSDGGYIIVGHTESFGAGAEDVYLVKTNSVGHELWHKTFGGSDIDIGYSVQQTTDGGYIIAGKTYSRESYDVYLIKIDSEGNKKWEETLGSLEHDSGWAVQQTSDGGYVIVGYTNSLGEGATNIDAYLVKTDSEGKKCGVKPSVALVMMNSYLFSRPPMVAILWWGTHVRVLILWN
jgi:hypothetical protein